MVSIFLSIMKWGGIEMFASNEYLQKVSSEQALTFDYLMRYIHKK